MKKTLITLFAAAFALMFGAAQAAKHEGDMKKDGAKKEQKSDAKKKKTDAKKGDEKKADDKAKK